MASKFYTENPQFYVSVDCIIFGFEDNKLKVLLQERNFDPFRGELSLMGGFVQAEESLDEAAARVMHERTGLTDTYLQQIGTFGAVDRDPGARVISTAYLALIYKANFDESRLIKYSGRWVDVNKLPVLFFDHVKMLRKARLLLQDKITYTPVGFNLLPPEFTIGQLQSLYEAILGESIDKRNFRKRINDMKFIEKTGGVDRSSSRRGAALYRLNMDIYQKNNYFRL